MVWLHLLNLKLIFYDLYLIMYQFKIYTKKNSIMVIKKYIINAMKYWLGLI